MASGQPRDQRSLGKGSSWRAQKNAMFHYMSTTDGHTFKINPPLWNIMKEFESLMHHFFAVLITRQQLQSFESHYEALVLWLLQLKSLPGNFRRILFSNSLGNRAGETKNGHYKIKRLLLKNFNIISYPISVSLLCYSIILSY